jgi:hypothetical protein
LNIFPLNCHKAAFLKLFSRGDHFY